MAYAMWTAPVHLSNYHFFNMLFEACLWNKGNAALKSCDKCSITARFASIQDIKHLLLVDQKQPDKYIREQPGR